MLKLIALMNIRKKFCFLGLRATLNFTGLTESRDTTLHDRSEQTFFCKLCSHTYKWKCDLVRHMKNVHGADVGPFICSACNRQYKNRRSLRRHNCC